MYNNQYMNPYTNQYRPNNNQTNITWVQGIESAKAYQLPSNSSVLLMDNENDGGNPEQAFNNMANQMGVNPNDILNMLK